MDNRLPAPTLYEFVKSLILRNPNESYEFIRTISTGYICIRDEIPSHEYHPNEPAVLREINEVQERVQAELGSFLMYSDVMSAYQKAIPRIEATHRSMDDDGLQAALRDCGAVLRWNTTARRIEVQWIDLPAGWHVVTGAVLDMLMNAVSKVATMTARGDDQPWAAKNAGCERRLLTAVAMRRQEKGPGTHVYVATLAWDASLGVAGRCLSITAIVKEIDALHHWENALRTSADVYADVSTGLTDTGKWEYFTAYKDFGIDRLCVWVRAGARSGVDLKSCAKSRT